MDPRSLCAVAAPCARAPAASSFPAAARAQVYLRHVSRARRPAESGRTAKSLHAQSQKPLGVVADLMPRGKRSQGATLSGQFVEQSGRAMVERSVVTARGFELAPRPASRHCRPKTSSAPTLDSCSAPWRGEREQIATAFVSSFAARPLCKSCSEDTALPKPAFSSHARRARRYDGQRSDRRA